MKYPLLRLFFATLLATDVFSFRAEGGVSYRTVALSDSDAPDAGSGAVFQLFSSGRISGGGDVTGEFLLKSGVGGVDLSNDAGIWHLPRGGLIAREGAPAPLAPNAAFNLLDLVSGTDSLAVVYKGRLAEAAGVTFKNDDGIWRWSPGGVRLIAREGDPLLRRTQQQPR